MQSDNHPLAGASDLCRMDASALCAAFAARALSPVEVAVAAMDRADAINPKFNAFTMIDRAAALDAARQSESRWHHGAPLSAIDGVPTTIKDIVHVQGWAVRYGSTTTPADGMATDAPSVARLRAAGAVFIGQTTTPEFGWKAVTDSPANGITRNPWDSRKTPGGSSGGAAVAAATGCGVFHLGTDGGGSIRVPASFTGTCGLKPTFGRVAAYPLSPFGTVAHIGPMARSCADLKAMLAAMAGRDLRDWAQGPGQLPPLDEVEGALRGARIGYWSHPASGKLDAEVAQIVGRAVAALSGTGAVIEPVDLPGDDLLSLFHHHWFTGAAARLASIPPNQRSGIDPGFLEVAEAGGRFGSVGLATAHRLRAEFGAAMDALLTSCDFIVSPAASIPAFDAGQEVPQGSGLTRWTEWAGFSYPINLSQQPAVVIPCGMTAAGLPVGLQIIGARGQDARVLSAAADLEPVFKPYLQQVR